MPFWNNFTFAHYDLRLFMISTTIQLTGNITHVGVERIHRVFCEAQKVQHSWASICLGLTCRWAHEVSMVLALMSDEQGDLGGNGSSQRA
jgi:hypothetical protein